MLGFGPDAWAYAVVAVTLVVASVTDVRQGRIYNWTTYPAVAVGLIGHSVLGGVGGTDHLVALLAGRRVRRDDGDALVGHRPADEREGGFG
ncbi:MAG: hypothetical protein KGY81_05540, partial [Phycisphaerae bacterium]|nr:hypothetical protein [Phycisphaerae bacterium]